MNAFEQVPPLSVDDIKAEMSDRMATLIPPTDGACWRHDPQPSGELVHVPDLLRLDGDAFVVAIYRDLLGREPDPEGMRHHLALLAQGRGKLDLVLGLRESPEGVAFGSILIGVVPRSRLHRLYRLPVVGRLLGVTAALLRVRALRRDVQNLHDLVLRLQHAGGQQQDVNRRQREAALGQQDILSGLQHAWRNQQQVMARLRTRQANMATGAQVAALSARLEAAEDASGAHLDEMGTRLDAMGARLDAVEAGAAREADLRTRLEQLAEQVRLEPWSEPLLLVADRQEEAARQLQAIGALLRDAERVDEAVRLFADAFGPLAAEQGWAETGAALVARASESLRRQEERIRSIERLAQAAHADMLDQQRRLGLLLETVRRRSEPLDHGQLAVLAEQQDHLLDPLYVQFEARFRGSRELIKTRQGVHLAVMGEAGAGTPDRPVIDVGAGRGEWLELLREHGLAGRGIDLNGAMVEACRERGLDCVQEDAVAGLSRMADGSVGAVTGFHIIEHLPFRTMVALLDEALRVLAPGGVILFETPNPANLQVGSRWFYLDPTHRNPLPGEMVAMIAEARGFNRVRIQPLHPMTESFDALDARLGEQLDALLHGPMDYALIAFKA